ncbi:MAG TPA: PQQ-binding-like beta-propeller repeat protein [Actinomycetota bacterium]|nr:PQQ-binding-like beta-propeller repeat protein [Actinomycetota bacterium]
MDSAPAIGFVHDLQGNAVPGVVVSDGLNVVTTGIDGSFSLPGWGSLVWVCPPSGWSCKQWWHPRDAGIRFVLSPAPRTVAARIVHATDLHLSLREDLSDSASPARSTALHPFSGAVRNSGAGLLVVTGDVTDRGTVGELKAAVRQLNRIGVPFRLLPGNHDHYGHHDEPRPADDPVPDAELGSGTFTRWEEVVGPRWWSMNHGGLHLVALDWFSARTGADRRAQVKWLLADLAKLPPGYPVVLLSHDQPDEGFLHALRRESPFVRLVAVLSGHWHEARAVRHRGTLHLTTGPGLVGGRSCSPPQIRILDWDGESVRSRIVPLGGHTPPRSRSFPPQWAFHTRVARSHSLQLAASPQGLVVTTADHESGAGTVTLLEGHSGRPRWLWTAPHPVPSSAAIDQDGAVYVQTSAGMVVRLDGGRPTWMVESADSVSTRVTGTPLLTGDGGVITEGPGLVQCSRCADGRVRWVRYVGNAEVHYSSSNGMMCDGLALVPFAGTSHGLAALNPEDGRVVWADERHVPHPRSTPAALGDGTAVLVREGATVERFEVATGRVVWRTSLGRPASSATPQVVDELVLVVTGDAVICILDSRTGWLLRTHRLPASGEAPRSSSTSPRVHSAVLAAGDLLHVITVTGEWWRLDPYHWEPHLAASLPVAVSSPPLLWETSIVIPGREGVVLGADLRSFAADAATAVLTGSSRRERAVDRWRRSLRLPKP